MTTQHVVESRQDAIEMLAKRAAVGRMARMEKSAEGDPVGSFFDWVKQNPGQSYPLLGAAGGAALGGLMNVGREKEDRTVLPSMLTGALAGGGLGLGAGLLTTRPEAQQFFQWVTPGKDSRLTEDVTQGLKNLGQSMGVTSPEANVPLDKLKQHYMEQYPDLFQNLGELSPELQNAAWAEASRRFSADVKGGWGEAVGKAVGKNLPMYAGAGAGIAGIEGARHAPRIASNLWNMGDDLMAGARASAAPEVVSHLDAMPDKEVASLARRSSYFNPKNWGLFGKAGPGLEVPGTPEIPGEPVFRKVFDPKNDTAELIIDRSVKPTRPGTKGHLLSRTALRNYTGAGRAARLAGAGGAAGSKVLSGLRWGGHGLLAGYPLVKTLLDASKIQGQTSALNAISKYKSLGMTPEQIIQMVGPEQYNLAQQAAGGAF